MRSAIQVLGQAKYGSVDSKTYDGLQDRIQTARWSPDEQSVRSAVKEGFTEIEQLKVATGLPEARIKAAIDALITKGALRRIGEAEPDPIARVPEAPAHPGGWPFTMSGRPVPAKRGVMKPSRQPRPRFKTI